VKKIHKLTLQIVEENPFNSAKAIFEKNSRKVRGIDYYKVKK